MHEDDELQGYDVKNAKRNKKKQKVNKFKDYQYYNEHNWLVLDPVPLHKLSTFPQVDSFFMYYKRVNSFPQFMTLPNLTTQQWDELIEQYVEIVVDGMDWKTMHRFVTDVITQDMKELESRQDLLDEIKYSFDQEFLDELLDNVTTVTYGLKEGESITFPVHQKKVSWPAVPIFKLPTISLMVGIFV